MPRRFAIKPDPIEAEQFNGTPDQVKQLTAWVKGYNPNWHITSRTAEHEEILEFMDEAPEETVQNNRLSIFAPGEVLSLRVGDWLVLTEKEEWRVLTNIMMTRKYDEIKDNK